jgi:hypothetical protein
MNLSFTRSTTDFTGSPIAAIIYKFSINVTGIGGAWQ